MKKEILIDFDGTINDCFKRYHLLHNKICKSLNLETINYNSFIFLKKKKIKNIELFKSSKKVKKIYIENWLQQIEKKKFLRYDELFPGILNKLNIMSKENILYLNTYRQSERNFKNQIENYKIKKFFKKIFFISNKLYPSKKSYFIESKFENLVIIGDTEQDFNIKKKALKIGVSSGLRNRKFLKNKTNLIFSKFQDIKNV